MLRKALSLAAQASDDEPESTPAEPELRAWTVGLAEAGERLDRALAQWLPEFSRSHAQWLLAEAAVLLDGVPSTKRHASHRLRLGQLVQAELRLPQSASAYVAEPIALDVRFEDEHLLVIHKPAGLVVHPGAGNWRGTLLNGLLHRYEASHCGPGITPAAQLPRAGIVHRLDKDTSGLMLVARSAPAAAALVSAIARREVAREYLALAQGRVHVPAEASGEWKCVDAPIGRDPGNRLRMAVLAEANLSGKPARTHFQQLGVAAQATHTLLRCKLDTGRTHQIRVHLAHLGHPITGDAVYGKSSPLIGRQALHAWRLSLAHPITARALAFEAPPPPDMAGVLAGLGLHYN